MNLSELDASNFVPLHKRLLVKRVGKGYEGRIIFPEQGTGPQMTSGMAPPTLSHDKSKVCEVLAIGAGVRGVKVGDKVSVPGAGNCYPDLEDGDHILIREGDIAGIV